jgi:probable addiction module antidote protein
LRGAINEHMTLKTIPWDAAKYLKTPAAQQEFLRESFDSGDPTEIRTAIGIVARAVGMTQIANDAGIRRESLYKALSGEGNPEFNTVVKVLSALGLALSVQVKTPAPKADAKRTTRPRKAREAHA